MRILALISAAPLLLANTDVATLPMPIRGMMEAAMKSGNDAEVATIVKYAKAASPEWEDQIDQVSDQWKSIRAAEAARKRREELARLQGADVFELWKGRVELGGNYTTGNSDTTGLTGSLDVTREALRWRHKLRLLAEYQESLGISTREHFLAAYEPNFKFSDNAYIYGSALYESDRFLGFYNRISVSTGAGYSALKRPDITLDLELGPAFRHTSFTDQTVEQNVAARGSLDFDWKLTPAITFSQDASAYLQEANSTVTSLSALRARLFGPLSAQFSYAVQFESKPPVGRQSTDTTTRASLVVDF